MISQPHKILMYYGAFLIAVGLLAFAAKVAITGEVKGLTPLIPAFLGLIFFPMNKPVKDGNRNTLLLALGLSLAVGAMMVLLFFRIDPGETADVLLRKRLSFGAVIFSSFLAAGMLSASIKREN